MSQVIAEWKTQRIGNITGSKISCLFTEPKLKEAKEKGLLSETAQTYLKELICELITGTGKAEFTTDAMRWGIEHEPFAIDALRSMYNDIEYFGGETPRYFEYSDFSGCSPDGISNKIVFEVKCPYNSANHLEFVLCNDASDLKAVNKDYWYQLQFNMLCISKSIGCEPDEMTGVFASYDPRFPENNQLKVIEVKPDNDFITKVSGLLSRAERYMSEILNRL